MSLASVMKEYFTEMTDVNIVNVEIKNNVYYITYDIGYLNEHGTQAEIYFAEIWTEIQLRSKFNSFFSGEKIVLVSNKKKYSIKTTKLNKNFLTD